MLAADPPLADQPRFLQDPQVAGDRGERYGKGPRDLRDRGFAEAPAVPGSPFASRPRGGERGVEVMADS